MSSANDTTTVLDVGTGGDTMDESNILEADFDTGAAPASVGKRPRIVIGGEKSRSVIVEPVRDGEGYSLPVVDLECRRMLAEILDLTRREVELWEAFAAAALNKP